MVVHPARETRVIRHTNAGSMYVLFLYIIASSFREEGEKKKSKCHEGNTRRQAIIMVYLEITSSC
jgi:hypothetical protein